MRYDKNHKAQTRSAVVRNASERFRRDGIQAVGIASLMADTGLTHGGFYVHFKSKEELVEVAIGAAFDSTIAALRYAVENPGKRAPIEALIGTYLSRAHRDHPAQGCAVVALGPEVARMSAGTRHGFTRHIEELVGLIAQQLNQKKDRKARRQAAAGIFATMVGALQMARAVDNETLSLVFIDAGRAAALASARAFGLR